MRRPPDMLKLVARNLRRIRSAQGLSQEEVAFRAGLDRSYISLLENAKYAATVVMLGKLAIALKVEPAELLRK